MMEAATVGQVFEAGMLACFGVSWPVDILKSLRSRRTEGKSLAFMVIILIGYCSGLIAKFVKASAPDVNLEMVTVLYALNLTFVAIDIGLYLHFRKAGRPALQSANEPH